MPQNRIAFLRRRAGMSHADIASRMGVSENTVRRWEPSKQGMTDENKLALADIFDVSVSFLMGWNDAGNGNGDTQDAAA